MKNSKYKLKKTKYGFFQVDPLPSKEELDHFYKEMYFQQQKGEYLGKESYSPQELVDFENIAKACEWYVKKHKVSGKNLLDLGCGQGYFSNYFLSKNWNVTLCDYSIYGLESNNPELRQFFRQGDLLEELAVFYKENQFFDLINLDNVLEHTPQPEELLLACKRVMKKGSLLRIEVPNDFSIFQKWLIKNKELPVHWVSPPEHLNYFNSETIETFLTSLNFNIKDLTVASIVEFFLAHPFATWFQQETSQDFQIKKSTTDISTDDSELDSDFLNGFIDEFSVSKKFGKAAHFSRVDIENYIMEQGLESYIKFFETLKNANLGRTIICYVSLGEKA